MLFALFLSLVAAGAPRVFPPIDVTTIAGKERRFPDPLGKSDRAALVMVAFTREAQKPCDDWFEIARDFPRLEPLEIAIFPGAIRLLRGVIVPAMKRRIPVARHDAVLTHWGDTDEYAEALAPDDRGVLHVYLVAPSGAVLWSATGEPTVASVESLRRAAPR